MAGALPVCVCPLPGAPLCSGPLPPLVWPLPGAPLPGAPLCSGPLPLLVCPLPGAPVCSGPLPLLPGTPLPLSGDELGEDEPCTCVKPDDCVGAPNPGVDVVRQLQASVSVNSKFEDSKHGAANSGYGNTDGTQDSTHVQLPGEDGVGLLDGGDL